MERGWLSVQEKPRTGIVRDLRFLNHDPGHYHLESPKRLEVTYAMLDKAGMWDRVQAVPPRRADPEEICMIHTADYLACVAQTSGKTFCSLDPDTATSPGSFEAAMVAAGSVCEAVSMVLSGNIESAFALVRPPGHHAIRNRAMGFCLFNNVAIGARYAQKRYGLDRILVVDWDIHHGNGTQQAFEDDPSVLYFSTHQYPFYPGSGRLQEIGCGKGLGFTMNVPLPPGQGDTEYLTIFKDLLMPVAMEYVPELVLVSAGFDIHRNDPLGGMLVTERGFAGLTGCVLEIARATCGGKVVMALEGGYDLKGLEDSVKAVLLEMTGATKTAVGEQRPGRNSRIGPILKSLRLIHGRFWKCLA
jgi:acetoin utilization deacetylase AcuC-like enzyme